MRTGLHTTVFWSGTTCTLTYQTNNRRWVRSCHQQQLHCLLLLAAYTQRKRCCTLHEHIGECCTCGNCNKLRHSKCLLKEGRLSKDTETWSISWSNYGAILTPWESGNHNCTKHKSASLHIVRRVLDWCAWCKCSTPMTHHHLLDKSSAQAVTCMLYTLWQSLILKL